MKVSCKVQRLEHLCLSLAAIYVISLFLSGNLSHQSIDILSKKTMEFYIVTPLNGMDRRRQADVLKYVEEKRHKIDISTALNLNFKLIDTGMIHIK
jgi:hypothetical protein